MEKTSFGELILSIIFLVGVMPDMVGQDRVVGNKGGKWVWCSS